MRTHSLLHWRTSAAALSLATLFAVGAVGCATTPAPDNTDNSATSATTLQSDQTAIEDTITRADNEQAQALTSGDASVMADTSTPSYLQQLTQVNQDLASSGVTNIALANLGWGPVSVNGDSASATTYETWTTTMTDGSTVQSRDENDYTLTLENGNWLIVSDDHPSAAPAAQSPSGQSAPAPQSPSGQSAPATSNASNVATSSNWAGYAATNGTYTGVSGTWTIPDYSSSSSAGLDATWVGIGGVRSTDLIQAGTQEQTSGSGQTEYQAWIETLPQASRNVPLTVHAGDSVSVSIDQQGTGTWAISFTNNTTGQTYQQTVRYTSSLSSAEWIEEAPSAARAGVLPLDNFGSVSFTGATAVKNGQTVTMSDAGATGITMMGATRQALAEPSNVGSDGQSFSVSRTAAAATPQQLCQLSRGW